MYAVMLYSELSLRNWFTILAFLSVCKGRFMLSACLQRFTWVITLSSAQGCADSIWMLIFNPKIRLCVDCLHCKGTCAREVNWTFALFCKKFTPSCCHRPCPVLAIKFSSTYVSNVSILLIAVWRDVCLRENRNHELAFIQSVLFAALTFCTNLHFAS